MKANETQRYSADELAEFSQIIEVKLAKARKELRELTEAIQQSNTRNASLKNLEDTSELANAETWQALAQRQQKFIRDLEAAQSRIAQGTYGLCMETGRLIGKERLRLVPHTTHCVEAKNRRINL